MPSSPMQPTIETSSWLEFTTGIVTQVPWTARFKQTVTSTVMNIEISPFSKAAIGRSLQETLRELTSKSDASAEDGCADLLRTQIGRVRRHCLITRHRMSAFEQTVVRKSANGRPNFLSQTGKSFACSALFPQTETFGSAAGINSTL